MKSVVLIWKEKGNWDRDAYTAVAYDGTEEARSAVKAFRGVLSCMGWYTDTKEGKALGSYFKEHGTKFAEDGSFIGWR